MTSLLMKVTRPPTVTVISAGLTPVGVIVTTGGGAGEGAGAGVGDGPGVTTGGCEGEGDAGVDDPQAAVNDAARRTSKKSAFRPR